MTALKTLRRDLGAHLADGLSATHAPLGALVNPPAVIVRPAPDYVTASTYCLDTIAFEAVVVSKPGDPAAVTDALDDLIDKVRSTLRRKSGQGFAYGFRDVSGPLMYPSGDLEFPAVIVTIRTERDQ